MAGWTSSLHPRASDGKFKGGGGGRSRVGLVGKGRTLRYSRTPTRGEAAVTIGRAAAGGAAGGALFGGGAGAAAGGLLAGGNAAAKVFVLTRRTKKLGGR